MGIPQLGVRAALDTAELSERGPIFSVIDAGLALG
jgi:hypothetical protein